MTRKFHSFPLFLLLFPQLHLSMALNPQAERQLFRIHLSRNSYLAKKYRVSLRVSFLIAYVAYKDLRDK